MWTLYIDDDVNNRTVLKLTRSEYIIGREEGSSIRLTERNISRRHAELQATQGGRWTLKDLDSDNGCFVNGRRVVESIQLTHGDLIQLGDYRLHITDGDVVRTQPELEDDTLRAVPDGSKQDQQDRLVVLTGPNTGAVYPLHIGSILMGRGEECEIALTDTSVSRVHAEVVGSDTGYELIDRGSANGLHVNGVELARTFLEPSDVIELGDVLLKFVPRNEIFINTLSPTNINPLADPVLFSPISTDHRTTERRNRIAFVISLVALSSVLLAFTLLHERPVTAVDSKVMSEPKVSAATMILEEAKRLHREGNLTQAHDKLRELPPDTNLRKSVEVMEIERSWADVIFDMVNSEPDIANKRSLLNEIAATEGTNSEQRKRAAAQLQSLETPSVDVTQLPVDETPTPAARPVKSVAAAPPPRPSQPTSPAHPAASSRDGQQSAAPAKPAAAPPPEKDDGLIRKLPF